VIHAAAQIDRLRRLSADRRAKAMDGSIERRSNLSNEEFIAQYLLPRRPVIITDVAEDWKALQWTPAFFKERFGDRIFTIDERQWRLADYIDAVENATPENPAPYLRSVILRRQFPELLDHVAPPHRYMENNWLRRLRGLVPGPINRHMQDLAGPDIFIGAPGARLRSLHQDVYNVNSFITQFYGSKEFVFFPPAQTPYLYPEAGETRFRSRVRDPFGPVDLEEFPEFRNATPLRCTMQPGETLYVPVHWWHASNVVSISINGVFSVVNQFNWADYISDVRSRLGYMKTWSWAARPVSLYFKGLGKVFARTSPLARRRPHGA
jgi:histone arginine demethylase JMJD6